MGDNQPETTTQEVNRFFFPRKLVCWIQYRNGGPKNLLFFQGLVICSELAQYLVLGLLMTFLTDDLRVELTHAAAIVNVHDGLTALLSTSALSLANLVGRYPILLFSSCFHSMGMACLSLSALPIYFNDESNRFHSILNWLSKSKAIPFYMGLFLMALGIAGQSASLREFLADQLSAHYHDEDEERAKACTRFQMRVSMVTAIILSNVLVSFNWALVVGAIALLMGFGTGVFCAGTPFYTGIKRCGSPVKCGLPVSHPALDDTQLHQKHNNEDSNQLTSVSLTITNSPRGSAEVATCAPSSHAMNRQENKIKVGKARPIVFMLTTFIIVGLVSSIGNTLFIEQANALHNTRFPVFILLICASLSRWITSHIYTSLQKKLSISPSQQSLGIRIRMGLGMFLFLLCSAIAEGVEDKRLDVIRKHGLQDKPNDVVPMSVLSLLPQFILLGSAEGLSWDGLENFLDEQLPESKKMYASSLSKGMNGVGKILSVVCVAIVEAIEPTWFSDSISKSHLDKFYRMLTIFSFLNLFWYFCVARYLTSNEVIENGQVEPERTEHPVYNAVLYNSKFLMAAVGSLSSLDASEEAELWSIFKALGFARVQ